MPDKERAELLEKIKTQKRIVKTLAEAKHMLTR